MKATDQMNYIEKAFIGASGTTLSVVLSNISVIVSIVAGVLTAIYMFEQWRKTRNARKWAEQDRNRE